MRDRHRLKEKYEVVLDSRQVRNLLVGVCLALGGVFTGGFFLGKSFVGQPPGEADVAEDPLAALDQRTQRLEEVRADAALTFQDELTRQRPLVMPTEQPPRVVVVQPAPGEEHAAAPAPAPAPAAPPTRIEPPRAESPRAAPTKPLNDKPSEEAVPTRMNSGENAMKEALARATRRVPETSPNGALTLQLAASQSRSEAERFAANLRDKGYAPYIVEAQVDGKGTFYRVRMGRFPSKEAAQKYLQDFKRETQLDAFIAPAN